MAPLSQGKLNSYEGLLTLTSQRQTWPVALIIETIPLGSGWTNVHGGQKELEALHA